MSNFLGGVNKELALYAVIKHTGTVRGENTYTMTDDSENVLIWRTEKIIDKADGNHYFLIEGKVKEHKEDRRVKQTVLTDCDWELIDNTDNIQGEFYGKTGDLIELDNVTANYRKARDTEWIVNGQFSVTAPVSEYRLIIPRKFNTFVLPYDSKQKLNIKSKGKFNITGKIIGHRIEEGAKATFIYPIAIEDKNGPFYGSKMHGRFLGGLRG